MFDHLSNKEFGLYKRLCIRHKKIIDLNIPVGFGSCVLDRARGCVGIVLHVFRGKILRVNFNEEDNRFVSLEDVYLIPSFSELFTAMKKVSTGITSLPRSGGDGRESSYLKLLVNNHRKYNNEIQSVRKGNDL